MNQQETDLIMGVVQKALSLVQERMYEAEIRLANLEQTTGLNPLAVRQTLERHAAERRAIA